jgi:hypothetical protein
VWPPTVIKVPKKKDVGTKSPVQASEVRNGALKTFFPSPEGLNIRFAADRGVSWYREAVRRKLLQGNRHGRYDDPALVGNLADCDKIPGIGSEHVSISFPITSVMLQVYPPALIYWLPCRVVLQLSGGEGLSLV